MLFQTNPEIGKLSGHPPFPHCFILGPRDGPKPKCPFGPMSHGWDHVETSLMLVFRVGINGTMEKIGKDGVEEGNDNLTTWSVAKGLVI